MNTSISTMFKQVNIPTDQLRALTATRTISLVAVLGHILFALFFNWLELENLTIFNIGGILIWSIAYLINRRGRTITALSLGSAVVLAHAVYGTYTLGWGSGFYLYLLCFVPPVFAHPRLNLPIKMALAGGFCALYLVLSYYTQALIPGTIISPIALRALFYIHAIINFLLLAFISHYHQTTLTMTGGKLEYTAFQLEQLASADPLTGLLNRKTIMEKIEAETLRVERSGNNFAVVLGDIDDFKALNDRYGYESGNNLLVSATQLVRETTRKLDQIARWGGGEFLLLLPETDMEGGAIIAEKIREKVKNATFDYRGQALPITMTFGVNTYDPQEGVDTCIRKADLAMQEGKQSGKNCVVLASHLA
jgi:diguanylate cyclase (GGDEF)-like protein